MKKRKRQSPRRSGYDYASPGRYFVTICTTDRGCLFGQVADGEMVLNDAGRMIDQVWADIPVHYPGIGVDAVQVMPNHIHGILVIEPVGAGPCARPNDQPDNGRPRGAAPTQVLFLPDVMERFKSLTTTRYITGVRNSGWEPFRGRLWQRNYHDRIIRNEQELNRIREYIGDNPPTGDQTRITQNDRNHNQCVLADAIPAAPFGCSGAQRSRRSRWRKPQGARDVGAGVPVQIVRALQARDVFRYR